MSRNPRCSTIGIRVAQWKVIEEELNQVYGVKEIVTRKNGGKDESKTISC